MYCALFFLVALGFVYQAVSGMDIEIEAWSEASDMESMKYHWIDEATNSLLDARERHRARRAMEQQDDKIQRTLKQIQNAMLRENLSQAQAAFMICENVVQYCDEYDHLNICNFAQWQDICVRTCDKEFKCEEGEVESCGVTEAITQAFKEAYLATLADEPSNIDALFNTEEKVQDALAVVFEEMGSNPPSLSSSQAQG